MLRRFPFATAIALSGGLLLASSSSHARTPEEWTRFRGPNGSGISVTAFNKPITEKDFLWKVPLPGSGHSSPVIFGGKVYITASNDQASRFVVCLDAADGKVAWQREYKSKTFRQHKDNNYASSTPAVDEKGIYLSWTTPDEYTAIALDHSGKEIWKKALGNYVSQHGSGSSPIVVEGVVILTNDEEGPRSTLVGLNRENGDLLWKVDRKESNKTAMSTPCLFRGKEVIISSKSHGITAIDAKTGKTIWEAADAFTARPVGSPVCTDDLIVATAGEGLQQRDMVAVRPPSSAGGEPEIAYKLSKTPPYVPTPIIKGEHMYMWGDSGTVTCVKLATGEQVWSEKVGGNYYGSPVCAGDTLWCISRKGELYGIAASPEKFQLVGKLELGEDSHATPAIAGGKMYLRTVGHLICVGPGGK